MAATLDAAPVPSHVSVRRRERWTLGALVTFLVVALLGPALGWGYVLTYDLVFVPRQSLLPESVGLSDSLPRAVPQDAVVALLTHIAPGAVWQHLALISAIALSSLGAARMLRGSSLWVRCAAATLAVWNPWFVERLYIGHWALLLGYAVLPWALIAARQGRSGRTSIGPWILWVALGSLVPTSGVLLVVVTLPVLLVRSVLPRARKTWAVLAACALQLPWLVPALTNPSGVSSDPTGVSVFGLRAEGPWGAWVSALGLGGIWNSEVAPATRGTILALLGLVLIGALAIAGWSALVKRVGRSVAYTLTASGLGGLVIACVSTTSLGLATLEWASTHVGGIGLLRDSHKLLAPLALLVAMSAALGAERLVAALREPAVRGVVIAAVLVLPIVAMPDAIWGGTGRLDAVTYPDDWSTVRQLLASETAPGDVVALPWSTFRSFAWNARRTLLDPAPRAMPRTTVVDDTLMVARNSEIVSVSGEDPRAARIGRVVRSGAPLAPVLRESGVGWALLERGTPSGPGTANLTGLRPVFEGSELVLLRVDTPDVRPGAARARVLAVGVADFLATIVLLLGVFLTLRGAHRRRQKIRGT